MTAPFQLPPKAAEQFARDGAVVLRGLLNAVELAQLTAGIEHNLANLSPLALVASLATTSATANFASAAQRGARAPVLSTHQANLRLRGGFADDELAKEAAKIGKVAVTVTVTVAHIRSVNAPPTKVVIVGSVPELGNWDVKKGMTLVSTPDTFPIFTGTFFLPPKTKFEYKYAVLKAQEGGDGVGQQWEASNRAMMTAAAGAMDIKNEFIESRLTDPRITDEPFQLSAQEWSRWYKHHQSQLIALGNGQEA